MKDRVTGIGCFLLFFLVVGVGGGFLLMQCGMSPCYTVTDPTTGYSRQVCNYPDVGHAR